MTKRSIGPLLGALTVVLPGSIAAVVVLRTLPVYWGRDRPATAIVLAIAAALFLGLFELLVRQLLAQRLEHELRTLPTRPREATLDIASPRLSALLRARLDHAPMSLGEGISPFLTGLLVMLGLLGTLLGLFQTVQGAGHALTASADVAALRNSLSGPIAGLTRSFGCSAAGISASAMLGLALALVRRRERQTLQAIYAYAAGPLRTFSSSARQLKALEQLASQGTALPTAATAIESVGDKLGELTTRLIALQQTALDAQQRALRELIASVPGELARAASETGNALQTHVAPLLEQLAARSGEALAAQSSALSDLSRELSGQLERDAKLRRDDTAEALEALRVRLDEAESARAAAHSRELAAVTALHVDAVAGGQQRDEALAARWRELVSRLDGQLETARENEAARLRSLDAQMARLDAQLAAAHASETERLRSLDAQVQAARERESEQLQRVDALSTNIGSELARLSGELATQLEQRQASERSHDARAEQAVAQLSAASSAIAGGVAQQEVALERLVERLPALFGTVAESAQTSTREALEQLVELSERRLSEVSQLFTDDLAKRADDTRGWGERALLALERVDRSADLLDDSIARQSGGMSELLERVRCLLPELADAAQSGAASTLAQLRELTEQQAQRFVDLERGLDRGRELHAHAFSEQLTSHAAELEQRLARTSDTVQEAAAAWRVSSVEMQAVAQQFASSVERQREASDAWLESLGQIEAAVEHAGRRSASDALAEQLASTHELFGRQLEFQRELFEQLRGLRGDTRAPRIANGGRDVSARK